jgi:hypothetical protein
VIEWESRVEKVLLPAIEPLAAMLKGAGWTCDIERTPQGFKVAAFRGDMVVYGSRERPSLSFELQKGKDLGDPTRSHAVRRSLGCEDIRGQR